VSPGAVQTLERGRGKGDAWGEGKGRSRDERGERREPFTVKRGESFKKLPPGYSGGKNKLEGAHKGCRLWECARGSTPRVKDTSEAKIAGAEKSKRERGI